MKYTYEAEGPFNEVSIHKCPDCNTEIEWEPLEYGSDGTIKGDCRCFKVIYELKPIRYRRSKITNER
jgi:hypothetical protein